MKLYNKSEQKETRRKLRRDSTFSEKLIWRRIRNSQIAGIKFRRQYSIGSFILDFYTPEIRIAIELDGATHEAEEIKRRDEWRQKIIEGYNITFLRFTDTEVTNRIDDVLAEIENAVRAARGSTSDSGSTSPQPSP